MKRPTIRRTARGFKIAEFRDHYGNECSIQKSSIATDHCVWFGCDNPDLRVLAYHLNGGKPDGWVPLPLPNGVKEKDVSCNTRMHLTREQVEALLPILQHFVETGDLPRLSPQKLINKKAEK